jgi:hypothetical protein
MASADFHGQLILRDDSVVDARGIEGAAFSRECCWNSPCDKWIDPENVDFGYLFLCLARNYISLAILSSTRRLSPRKGRKEKKRKETKDAEIYVPVTFRVPSLKSSCVGLRVPYSVFSTRPYGAEPAYSYWFRSAPISAHRDPCCAHLVARGPIHNTPPYDREAGRTG